VVGLVEMDFVISVVADKVGTTVRCDEIVREMAAGVAVYSCRAGGESTDMVGKFIDSALYVAMTRDVGGAFVL